MGQLQGQAYFLFSASWGTLFLRPSCSTNGSIGQLQSGAWFVSFVMGQKPLVSFLAQLMGLWVSYKLGLVLFPYVVGHSPLAFIMA